MQCSALLQCCALTCVSCARITHELTRTLLCAVLRAAATDLRELRAQCCALMASAFELEIQERRVKKARLDVEEEEINVRRMELALQRSKVELPAGARAVDGARHARRLSTRRQEHALSERVWGERGRGT